MPIELNRENVTAALYRAVASKPEGYIYVNGSGETADKEMSIRCDYVHGDVCGCIVGTVLHDMGIPLSVLEEEENKPAFEVLGDLRAQGLITQTPEVQGMLTTAQNRQDTGSTWKDAADAAVAYSVSRNFS